jgi:hypothetical protein
MPRIVCCFLDESWNSNFNNPEYEQVSYVRSTDINHTMSLFVILHICLSFLHLFVFHSFFNLDQYQSIMDLFSFMQASHHWKSHPFPFVSFFFINLLVFSSFDMIICNETYPKLTKLINSLIVCNSTTKTHKTPRCTLTMPPRFKLEVDPVNLWRI